ncbi:PREDICTED: transcription factor HBP-1b(c38) [Theobroma cacao]|uniref:Transcription factor HBP-1b(C38) n=2 Tax=Theobroma cacao TaxID=3641 RepID=A0AB32V2W5_THECC|nr:PREDICTED: transcription factor HBP-1b(c38) [Theobroma cacao]
MTPGGSSTSTNHNAGSFDAFFQVWLERQEQYLDELLSVQQRSHEAREDDLKDLITRVLSHHQQYYEEKSRVAHRNIFLVFSPTWLSSFERASLWIAGFKPGFALKLVSNSVQDLSQEQSERIKRLMAETRVEERVLNDELARVQESIAAPPLLEIARKRARLMNAEIAGEQAALASLRKAVEEVVAAADLLRMTTAMRVVEILNPVQNVNFLTAATQLLVKLRNWGLQKDGERKERTSEPRTVCHIGR